MSDQTKERFNRHVRAYLAASMIQLDSLEAGLDGDETQTDTLAAVRRLKTWNNEALAASSLLSHTVPNMFRHDG